MLQRIMVMHSDVQSIKHEGSLKCSWTFFFLKKKVTMFVVHFKNIEMVEKRQGPLEACLLDILSAEMKMVSALKSYLWYFQRQKRIFYFAYRAPWLFMGFKG